MYLPKYSWWLKIYHIILHKTQFFVHLYQGFRKKNSANSFLNFEGKKITDEF